MAMPKIVRHIALLGLIIASVAFCNLTVTHVTAGGLFSDTSPRVTPHNPIPGNDTFFVIPNYDDDGNYIKIPISTITFPKIITRSGFYFNPSAYAAFKYWEDLDNGKL